MVTNSGSGTVSAFFKKPNDTFQREDKKVVDWMLDHPKEVIQEWESIVKNENGEITEVHCTYDPETKSGSGNQSIIWFFKKS